MRMRIGDCGLHFTQHNRTQVIIVCVRLASFWSSVVLCCLLTCCHPSNLTCHSTNTYPPEAEPQTSQPTTLMLLLTRDTLAQLAQNIHAMSHERSKYSPLAASTDTFDIVKRKKLERGRRGAEVSGRHAEAGCTRRAGRRTGEAWRMAGVEKWGRCGLCDPRRRRDSPPPPPSQSAIFGLAIEVWLR